MLGLPVTLFLFTSIRDLLRGYSTPYDTTGIGSLLIIESCLGLWTLYTLRRNGWRWPTISTTPALSDLGHTFLLLVLTIVVSRAGGVIHAALGLGAAWTPAFGSGLGVGAWLALVLINPLFEEGLWSAYAFNGPFRRNSFAALATSVLCRTAVHLGQGWTALFAIMPIALLWALYYRRFGRLLPVILTHALMNFFSLLPLVTGNSP